VKKENIQEEISKKIHPYLLESNFFRRTILLNLNVNGLDIYQEILKQTKEIVSVPIYFNMGKSKQDLTLFPEESRIILARFNSFLTQLRYTKNCESEENIYAYLSMNSSDTKNPFLGTGISIGNKYYGLSFLMIDSDKCMMEEISNISLENLVK